MSSRSLRFGLFFCPSLPLFSALSSSVWYQSTPLSPVHPYNCSLFVFIFYFPKYSTFFISFAPPVKFTHCAFREPVPGPPRPLERCSFRAPSLASILCLPACPSLSLSLSLSLSRSLPPSYSLFCLSFFLARPTPLSSVSLFSFPTHRIFPVSTMAHRPPSPVSTRSRKASLKDVSNVDEMSSLAKDVEERIRACFREEIAVLTEKFTKIESQLSVVQTECGRLGDELTKMKSIVVNQQLIIESHEQKLRANNLILHNIPEQYMRVGSETLCDDRAKLSVLNRSVGIEIHSDDIVSIRRLGGKRPDKIRPLKIVLKDAEKKFLFLNKRKSIASSDDLKRLFHNKIYVNSDTSILVRNEEYRLRQKLKEIKNSNPKLPSFIRSGVLYLDGEAVDKVDVKNQIF